MVKIDLSVGFYDHEHMGVDNSQATLKYKLFQNVPYDNNEFIHIVVYWTKLLPWSEHYWNIKNISSIFSTWVC